MQIKPLNARLLCHKRLPICQFKGVVIYKEFKRLRIIYYSSRDLWETVLSSGVPHKQKQDIDCLPVPLSQNLITTSHKILRSSRSFAFDLTVFEILKAVVGEPQVEVLAHLVASRSQKLLNGWGWKQKVNTSRLYEFIYSDVYIKIRNDHTKMTAPLPVCSAKLSIFWPG
jgi:hypothetical protein